MMYNYFFLPFVFIIRHLEGNSISKISKGWLYGLNKLLNLNISFNKIDQIVGGWEYCGHLEEL